MYVLATDDEQQSLERLIHILKEFLPTADIHGFKSSKEALSFAEKWIWESGKRLDLAFMAIKMSAMSGLELASKLKKLCPEVRIVFVTHYRDYAYDAFQIHAQGYLLKPVTRQAIENELLHLHVLPLSQKSDPFKKRVTLHTFGTFDAFVDQKPLVFSRTRAKGLLAYLADRQGNGVTISDICAVLFEDRSGTKSNKKHVQNIIASLRAALEKAGVDDILIKRWNYLALDTQKVDCDYYRFLEGDLDAIKSFQGEYMSNFSWAEFTSAFLNQQSGIKKKGS